MIFQIKNLSAEKLQFHRLAAIDNYSKENPLKQNGELYQSSNDQEPKIGVNSWH